MNSRRETVPASRTSGRESTIAEVRPHILHTRRSVFSSDCRRSPDAEERVPMQQSRRYSGAASLSDRKMSRQSLYSCGMGLESVENITEEWRDVVANEPRHSIKLLGAGDASWRG